MSTTKSNLKLKENCENANKTKYYAGIDLGGTFVKCGIVDDNGKIIIKDKIPTGKDRPYQEIALDMANLVKRLIKNANVSIEGVGIGSPGAIDSKNGVVVYANNLNWKNVPLGEEISKILGQPCKMTNDANAAALGEYSLIKNKYDSMVFLTLGTGIGGGVIIDGKLFEGYKSAGAELGHQVIRVGGEKCTCGRRGCFEAYSSTTALIRQAKSAMLKDKSSLLWEECKNNIEETNGITIFNAYHKDDKTAKRVVRKYIKYLAEGVANIINTFRPEIVLIGGGVSSQGDTIIKPLKRNLKKMIYGGTKFAKVIIDTAKLQNDAGLIGAAFLNK